MTPTEAGFDGAVGIRFSMPHSKNARFCLKRSRDTLPSQSPRVNFREQLIWLYPDDQPAQLLWCNADDQ